MKKKQIDIYIQQNKDSMIRELFDWTAHPSVSRPDLAAPGAPFGPDCRDMLTFALRRGKELGFEAVDHDGYCGDLFYGTDKDMEEFGFVCHLDVVPAGEGWIFPPFQPVEKDGFLIGRGINDNKGSAILVLWAVRFFMEHRIPLRRRIRIMLGCSEENGMHDFRHYASMPGASFPPLTIVPDAPFPVCFAQKGGWNCNIRIPAGKDIVDLQAGTARNSVPAHAELTLKGPACRKALELPARHPEISARSFGDCVTLAAQGKSGHAAFPEGTVNALTLLCRIIQEEGLDRLSDLNGLPLIAEKLSSFHGEGLGISFSDTASGALTLNAGTARLEARPEFPNPGTSKDGQPDAQISKYNHSADPGAAASIPEDGPKGSTGHDLVIEMDIRFPVTMDSASITAAFEKHFSPAGARIEQISISEPYYMDPDSPAAQTLMQIYRESTGRVQDVPYAMGGGTYSRVIPNAVSFGPGLPETPSPAFLPSGHGSPHGPDEAVHIESWLKCLEIYIRVIEAFCTQ